MKAKNQTTEGDKSKAANKLVASDLIDAIIESINLLSDEDRQTLTLKIRTTEKGIKAFQAFNYGAGNPINIQPNA